MLVPSIHKCVLSIFVIASIVGWISIQPEELAALRSVPGGKANGVNPDGSYSCFIELNTRISPFDGVMLLSTGINSARILSISYAFAYSLPLVIVDIYQFLYCKKNNKKILATRISAGRKKWILDWARNQKNSEHV